MPAQSKSPIPKPWDKVDPAPLPEAEDYLLDEVLSYAEAVANADDDADSVSMQKAASLDLLYQSMTWVEEWNAANPPKPDAIGRPVDPKSRNRFAAWLNWRAQRTGRVAPVSRRVYQLLNAMQVETYLNPGTNKYDLTEKQLRPFGFYLKGGMTDRIPEVERMLVEAIEANGDQVDAKLVARVIREHKATLGQRSLDHGKAVARTRPIRKDAEDDFLRLFKQSGPDEAKDFIRWAVAQLKVRAVSNEATA